MRMKAPPGMKSFSHGGVTHQVADDGHVEVTTGALAELKAHGLIPAAEEVVSKVVEKGVSAFRTFLDELAATRAARAAAVTGGKPKLKK